jgi:hypothetical protein
MKKVIGICKFSISPKKILVMLVWLCIQGIVCANAQNSPATFADSVFVMPPASDTLPNITMKFEPAYLIVWLVVPGSALFVGGHSYTIRGEKMASFTRVQPYFAATHDPLLMDLYRKHKQTRKLWYASTAAGSVFATIGFVQGVASIFNPDYTRSAGTYLLIGSGMMTAGLVARVFCFRNLRTAVNLYNHRYAEKNPRLSMHLGLPSGAPVGAALFLKF